MTSPPPGPLACIDSIGGLRHCDHTMLLSAVKRLQPPQLKRIYLWKEGSGNGLDIGESEVSRPVLREHIQLDGPERLEVPTDLVSTRTFGDLSALRVLKLHISVSPKTLPPPETFTSLVTLAFTCSTDPNLAHLQYWDEVAFLLRHLPRLATLQLREWRRNVPVASCLGPNLRTLDLSTRRHGSSSYQTRDKSIYEIAKCCPHLEKLAIEVRRTRGNAAEIAHYRALGRLRCLRHLDLTLDAAPPGFVYSEDTNGVSHRDTAVEPWFDEEDKTYL